MILRHIERNEVADAWPLIEPFAIQMQERFPDDWPLHETIRRSTEGDMFLWLVWSEDEGYPYAVIGTEVQVTASGKRRLTIMQAAGKDHRKWAQMAVERLEAHARGNHCAELKIDGRSGWEAALPHYKALRWVTLTKEFD